MKTSYSVSLPLMSELKEASKITGLSREQLAKRVLYKYIRYLDKKKIVGDNVVSYNKRNIGYKRQYFRWEAKEYVFLQQCRINMRHSISFLLARGIEKYLAGIVMAIIRARKKGKVFAKKNFKNLLLIFKKFFILWPHTIVKSQKPLVIRWKFHIF